MSDHNAFNTVRGAIGDLSSTTRALGVDSRNMTAKIDTMQEQLQRLEGAFAGIETSPVDPWQPASCGGIEATDGKFFRYDSC
ncbi:MAG: hypothetical protein ACYCW6_04955 [Candidatus Xenobia bacterium]